MSSGNAGKSRQCGAERARDPHSGGIPRGETEARDPEKPRLSRSRAFYVKYALLSPRPSPRGPPRRARATQLQPAGDKGSRGDGRAPKSSASPAHPGQRHLRGEGGSAGSRGRLRVRVRPAARTRRSRVMTGAPRPPPAPCEPGKGRGFAAARRRRTRIGRGAALAGRTGNGPS